MDSTKNDPKNSPETFVLHILEIIRYRTPKDTHTNLITLADISRDQPPHYFQHYIATREEYKERFIYRVETTSAEMKHLYKEAGSENENSPTVPEIDPQKFGNWRIIVKSKPAARCQNFEPITTRSPFYSIAKKTYTSPVGRDNGVTNQYMGHYKQTMELFCFEDGNYQIEWDIPAIETTEHIGVFCYERDKVLSDYDGVFEMPEQARTLLEENGFDCSYLD